MIIGLFNLQRKREREMRELQAILTLYLGTLLSGYNSGFPAVAIPDIKQEMRW